jgi:hypothetical protein
MPEKKRRPVNNPYEVWIHPCADWEWRVLKTWQNDDTKPFARWHCAVKTPYTGDRYDMGDVYVSEITIHNAAVCVWRDGKLTPAGEDYAYVLREW